MNLKTLLLMSLIVVGVSSLAYVAYGLTPSFEVAVNPNPVLTGSGVTVTPSQTTQNENVQINVEAFDVSGIAEVVVLVWTSPASTPSATITLFDDGQHSDNAAGDSNFGGVWNVGTNADGAYTVEVNIKDTLGNETQISQVVSIMVGTGFCVASSDCSVSEVCCAGSCAVDSCTSDNDCNDSNSGTVDTCVVSGCPSFCTNNPITTCTNGDGFCPATCTIANDSDCSDTTPPTVSVTDPTTDGMVISASPLVMVVNAVDAESGINYVEFYLDSEATPRDTQLFDFPSGSGDYNWVLDLAGVSNGIHTLTAIAYNKASLSTTVARTIDVSFDTTAPFNVSITSPDPGGTYSSSTTIPFVAHAEDDTDVSSVSIFSTAGGGPINTIDSSGISVDVAIPVIAVTVAALDNPVIRYAMEDTHTPLPFIPVARAATITTNGNCTTTTNSYAKNVYAMAYDSQGNSSPSATFPFTMTTSTTTCSGTGGTSSGGAS